MKINKTVLAGVILILFGGLLFITDALNPFIRPITYLFLMGSSKGKDILFFVLFGLFLIISQAYKIRDIKFKPNKLLLISIISAMLLFAIGLLLEVYLRLRLGTGINTIFITIRPSFSTTSILHSHIIKSVLGELLTSTIKPLIESNINTATSLFAYIGIFSIPVAVLIGILVVSGFLSVQKREPLIEILLCFFLTILIIGVFDGGIMGTPGALGLFGAIFIYWDEYYILRFCGELFKQKNFIKACIKYKPDYLKTPHSQIKFYLNRGVPYFIGLMIILLRISISIWGANPEYYEVDIYNPDDNLNLTDDFPITYVNASSDKIVYHIDPSLNEHNLTLELSEKLNHTCDHFTLSWNWYSYF
ncbi:MAG: hypothetical protein Q4P18_05115 [Methanobrevibacter sp.]|uniref:hypothetical protein n=1 Tax=Methanobrevibacter sp. TaxID=66852 RepID=UPI0026DFC8D9|nr:hypothetical protein [Methanobrevibacter sp.]MDO5848893.1 hypothetical protein [Methanobrevibacter sp.]